MWLVAINPHSGNGRGSAMGARVTSYLMSHNVDFQQIEGSSAEQLSIHLRRLLQSEPVKGVIAVGGDGLAHLVFTPCIEKGLPFAIIPAGTGNDFVRALGWNLEDVESILDRILDVPPTRIDMGRVDNQWFGAILSTGFDSVVNERANTLKWPKGPSRYNLAIALELPRFTPHHYRIETESRLIETEAMLIAIGNGKSYGGGMNICPDASLHDGLFDVVILKPVSKPEFIRTFPKVYSGNHTNHPQVEILRAQKVTVIADAIAYADGERLGPAPITAECVAGAGLTWVA